MGRKYLLLTVGLFLGLGITVDCRGRGLIDFDYYYDSTKGCDPLGAPCDFYFKAIKIEDSNGKDLYYKSSTGYTKDSSIVYFSISPTVDLPSNMMVYISMKVYDKDTHNDDYIRTMGGNKVDFGNAIVGQWYSKTFSSGSGQLKISYKLVSCYSYFTGRGCDDCVQNYYGSQCNRYCRPVSGSYTCNYVGQKICVGMKTGSNCENCQTYYYPRRQCTVYCKPTSAYTCSSAGAKICNENYYPAGQCNIYCRPVSGSYTCDSDGGKNCVGMKTGSNCENCQTYYYPRRQCTVYCKPTSGNYTCSSAGAKICNDNYYPAGQCDVFCHPRPEIYTCSSSGDRVPDPCSAGDYMTDSGCQQCGENTFSGAGDSSCTSCPDGKISNAGSTSAHNCYYAPCSAGDYMTDSGCQQCGENTFSGAGASSCTSCPDGKISNAGSTSCVNSNSTCRSGQTLVKGICIHQSVMVAGIIVATISTIVAIVFISWWRKAKRRKVAVDTRMQREAEHNLALARQQREPEHEYIKSVIIENRATNPYSMHGSYPPQMVVRYNNYM